MNDLVIRINTNGPAFEGKGLYDELRAIFQDLATQADCGVPFSNSDGIEDSEGNRVGSVRWVGADG